MEWYESLPDELKEAPFFKPGDGGPKPLDQVLADLKGAAVHVGNSIRIPGPDASEEDIKNFALRAAEKVPGLMPVPDLENEEALTTLYEKLGRPKEPDAYSLPEGVELSEDMAKVLKQRAHEYGMSNKQFQKMVSDMTGDQTEAQRAAREALEADLEGLRAEWGEALPVRIEKIAGLLEKSGAPEYLLDSLKNRQLTSQDMKWLYSMAEAVGSEGKPLTDDDRTTDNIDVNEALSQLEEIENNPALWDKAHPDHARLVARRVEMMKKAHPGSTTTF